MKLMTPVGDRILAEPIKETGITDAGLIVPEAHRDRPSDFIVVRIGTKSNCELKIGDRILVNRYSGKDVTINDRPYKILDRNDILARID